MAITAYKSASPTVGTAGGSGSYSMWSLAAVSYAGEDGYSTDSGLYSLTLDVSALAAGDTFQVQLFEKAVSAAADRRVGMWNILGPHPRLVVISPPVVLGVGWDWTLEKIAGTDRSLPFTLWRIT